MAESTQVSINGDRVALAFGVHFDVRYGTDDTVIRDAELVERAKNGDLLFRIAPDGEGANGGLRRVRPSTIDSIVGSGVDHSPTQVVVDGVVVAETRRIDLVAKSVVSARSPGETASDYLRRIERGLGSGQYARWIGTDPGQRALEEAAKEDQAARRTATKEPKEPKAKVEAPVVEKTPREIIAATKPSAGVPYAERNQVWRCGTCKRRTRKPECTGTPEAPHAAVAAPTGKRKADR